MHAKDNRNSLSSRRSIGLIADWFDEPYQLQSLQFTEAAAHQRGACLMSFPGGIPGSDKRSSNYRQAAFDLVGSDSVHGAILLAGTMVNEIGSKALEPLLSQLSGVPLCSVGVDVSNVPSIVIDNRTGIEQALKHLVEGHGCQRVAFIRGPVLNMEAESRFTAYQEALERAGMLFDEALVYNGDFLRASGELAAQHWLESQTLPDAIIAANDEMALGALDALTAADVRVPEEVKLIGFDDIEAARHANPPLTTVRQPSRDMMVTAVRTIMDQVQGRQVSQTQMLQTHLVVRESCGCEMLLTSTGQGQHAESSPVTMNATDDFKALLMQREQTINLEFARAARGEFSSSPGWQMRLLGAFTEEVIGNDQAFVRVFRQLVKDTANSGADVARWHDVISGLRRLAIPCAAARNEQRALAEDLLQQARLVTANAVERAQAKKRFDLERFMRTLTDVSGALAASYGLQDLSECIHHQLPRLGITACYLAVHEPFTFDREESADASRCVVAYDKNVPVPGARGSVFPTREVGPAELWPPERLYHFSVLPLFLKGRSMGYALLECRSGKGTVIEVVREQLSVALFGALLHNNAPAKNP